ncbi:hypothetical protein K7P76_04300 [Cohnella sp. NL03-T5]|uniref:Glycosyl hydrolase 109 C-terminal domain-containing protein n=1 Tax=Cohnella silvisoli TaxID=2873699 RepID=A0ABV1KPG4_9BACL|nr:Gfo/Idh/MocA family oxidoreductase [Cohnella silvisoli]MCD9021034.1 hypothetical protein [Cohnella silvisoli]
MKSLTAFVSKSRSLQQYFGEHYGKDHPAARTGFWRQGDSATVMLQTEQEVLISLRVDWTSVRPHNKTHYVLQGTEGAYVSGRHPQEDDLIWFKNRSPKLEEDGSELWEPLRNYQPEFDHPRWKQWGKFAAETKHGGGDFLVLEEFISAIQEDRVPAVDVYDAVTWSSVFFLSMESVERGGQTISIPDFKSKGWR